MLTRSLKKKKKKQCRRIHQTNCMRRCGMISHLAGLWLAGMLHITHIHALFFLFLFFAWALPYRCYILLNNLHIMHPSIQITPKGILLRRASMHADSLASQRRSVPLGELKVKAEILGRSAAAPLWHVCTSYALPHRYFTNTQTHTYTKKKKCKNEGLCRVW